MGFWNQIIKGKVLKVENVEVINNTGIDEKTIRLLAAQITPKQLMWSKDLCGIVPAYTTGNIRVPFMNIDEDGSYNYYDTQFAIKVDSNGSFAEIDVYQTEANKRVHMFTLEVSGKS